MIPRAAAARAEDGSRSHHSRRLVLALLGEFLRVGYDGPYRATTIIEVLEGAGIAAPASRAALDRFALRGFLDRERVGRSIEYRVTATARSVLQEASLRVHAADPFAPNGEGWTLVTFSVPEGLRGLRHQLRATLTWEGFAPLRDGLWIAPGRIDPEHALAPVRAELPPGGVLAFHADALDGFPVAEALHGAWDFEAIQAEHRRFIGRWADIPSLTRSELDPGASMPPLSELTLLVSDWLELLRRDPRLPPEFLGSDWPGEESLATYRTRRAEVEVAATSAIRGCMEVTRA